MRHSDQPKIPIFGLAVLLLSPISTIFGFPLTEEVAEDEAQLSKQAFRQYTCIVHQELEPADCRLTFMTEDDEPSTITDSGCFIEKDPLLRQLRNYCPLQCSGASFSFITSHRPTTPAPSLNQEMNSSTLINKSHSQQACTASSTFDVVKRRKDWFLWRSGDCLITEAQFDIGCVFSANGLAGEDESVPKKIKDDKTRKELTINSGEAKLNSNNLSISNHTIVKPLSSKEAELELQHLIQLRPSTAASMPDNSTSEEQGQQASFTPTIMSDQTDLLAALNEQETSQKNRANDTTEPMEGSGEEVDKAASH